MHAFLTQSRRRRLLPLPASNVCPYRRFKGSTESNPRSRPSCYTTSHLEALSLSWLPHVTNSRLETHLLKRLTFCLQQKGQRCVTAISVHDSDQLTPKGLHSPLLLFQNVNLWSSIRAALQREGHLQPPRVHVHASCGQQTDQLQRIVSDMGGEMAQSAGEQVCMDETASNCMQL